MEPSPAPSPYVTAQQPVPPPIQTLSANMLSSPLMEQQSSKIRRSMNEICDEWRTQHIEMTLDSEADEADPSALTAVWFEQSRTDCKCALRDCLVYQRVQFIMEFYMKWILIDQTESNDVQNDQFSQLDDEVFHRISMNGFLHKLSGYSHCQLWNDYFHIRQYHAMNPNGATKMDRNNRNREGRRRWNGEWLDHREIPCFAARCRILTRYHRNRQLLKDNEQRMALYNLKESGQTNEVVTQQLCDVVHCLLSHPIALSTKMISGKSGMSGMSKNHSLRFQRKPTPETPMTPNLSNGGSVFAADSIDVFSDDEDYEFKDEMPLNERTVIKLVDPVLYAQLRPDRMQCHKFLNLDNEQKANSDDDDNRNLSPSLAFKSLKRKRPSMNGMALGVGKRLTNCSFRTLPGLNEAQNEWEVFLSLKQETLPRYTKFDDFQEEMLNNEICSISVEQWSDSWKRAEQFGKTVKGKLMQSQCKLHGVRKGDAIPTHYVMALMLWSNFDILQRRFREHCLEV